MFYLLLYNETISSGYTSGILMIIDLISIIATMLIITSKNPIVSVLFLITLFLGISCHLFASGFNFIALSYLLVYVGAVSILFLFILMLINIRISELLNETSNFIPLALLIGFSFIYPLFEILSYNKYFDKLYYNYDNFYHMLINKSYKEKISFFSSKLWDGSLSETTHISTIGDVLYTNYSIWLILTSIILLLAMVGAIIITIKQK